MRKQVWIVGVGRPGFGDDAIGLLIADAMHKLLDDVAVIACETGGASVLLEALEKAALLVIIDAAKEVHGFMPGTWMRLDLSHSFDGLSSCRLSNTHTLGIEELLELGRSMKTLPSSIWLYAIAGHRFGPESNPSAAASGLLESLPLCIAADVKAWLRQQGDDARYKPC